MDKKVEFTPMKGVAKILFIVFLVLKLTGLIDWSWWWVVAPILIPIGLLALIMAILGIGVTFAACVMSLCGKD